MAAGKDTDNAEKTKRVDAPNASERGDTSNGLLNEVHDDRMRQMNDRSIAKDVGTERNKETAENSRTLDGAASAAKNGNLEALGKSVSEIYNRASGDGAKVKELSKQLSDKLKEDGIGVQADKDTFTFQKNGKAVNFAVKAELDYGTGEVKHSAKPVNNGEDPRSVLNGFSGKKTAESAAGTFSTADTEKQDAKRSVTGESGRLTGPDASGEEKTKKFGSDIGKEDQKATDQNIRGGVGRIPQENPFDHSYGDQLQAMSAKEVVSDGKDKKLPTSEEMPFKGREIKRDVPYEKTVVGPGQTLSQISAEHLGKGAGQGEIQKHVDEIAQFNGIKNPDKIKPGDALTLPGHTKEGGTITFDDNGSRITAFSDGRLNVERQDGSGFFRFQSVENHFGSRPQDNYSIEKNKDGSSTVSDWRGDTTSTNKDGSVRKEHTDGTGYVRQPGEKGSFTQQNFGPKPEDNFNILKGTDGKFRISDGKDDKVGREPKNATERLQLERERLKDGFDGAQDKDIQAIDRNIRDMKAFEKRAGEQGLSKEEIAKTYDQISQILEAKGDTPLTARDRTRVSDQVLHQAAHPEEVRQGFHNTCNVSTVEHRMYTKNPSEAARVVSEAARTGQVTTADGRSVKLPESSLKADSQAFINPPPDNMRGHASQLFQVAAVNEYYDRTNKASNPPGQVKYEQELSTGPTDTGERLYDYASGSRQPAKDSAGREMKPPSIPTAELETISNNLSGKNEKGFVMVNGAYADQNTTKFNSEKDMAQTLEQMKKDGKLPAILWVDAQHEPFFSDSGAGLAGGSGGAHVVSITDYDPKTGAASVDNQWQQSADHKVPLHDLFIASRSSLDPAALTMVGTDVAVNKALGQIDGAKELDYLRLQKNASKLNADEYDSKIIETMKANTERWKSNGETSSGEQAKATEKFEQLLRGMSSIRADAIRNAMSVP